MTDDPDHTPEYVLSGRDARGRWVTDIVPAHSADEAVAAFEGEGHTDVVLHTDETTARFITPSQFRKTISPREFIGYRTRGRLGCMLFLTRKLYQKTWHIDLVCLGIVVLAWTAGVGQAWFQVIPAAVILFPVLFAAYAELVSPAVAYKRMLTAVAWGRWDEVPRLLARVRKLALPPYERPLREAQALAGQGRLDEALDRFAAVADDPKVPPYLYWVLRAGVCTAGRDRAKALAASPGRPTWPRPTPRSRSSTRITC